MNLRAFRHPVLFYTLATAIPWALWGLAGWMSWRPAANVGLESALGLAGLCAPMLVASALILPQENLRRDLLARLIAIPTGGWPYLAAACVIMPASILAAQAVSLLFGYSASQFRLTGHFSFTSGIFPVWFLLLLAPLLEELGWHTYGTDALRSRLSLFASSILFAFIWGVWHAPLAGIHGYYQSQLVETGVWHALNFPISIFPFVMLMNWLYYKTGRSILVAVIFHTEAGYFNEIFATHPDSKLIQTGLLIALAAVVVLTNRRLFFRKLRCAEPDSRVAQTIVAGSPPA
jgi:uncharacterized protein